MSFNVINIYVIMGGGVVLSSRILWQLLCPRWEYTPHVTISFFKLTPDKSSVLDWGKPLVVHLFW